MDAPARPLPPVLQAIADAAWRETARLAVGALSRRPGPLGEAGRALAQSVDHAGPLPAGLTALVGHLAALAPEGVRDELVRTLDWELHTFRGGRQVETCHRLEPITPVHGETFAVPAAAPGFDAEVAAMDLGAPHSMGDLARYATAYLGRTFVDDAVDHARSVELHNGTAAEAMAALRARGFDVFHQLATPKLHFQLLAAGSTAEALRWAIACDDGPDMFRHLQKVLRAARASSGRRVDSARVSRFDHRPDETGYRVARFRRCFASSIPVPPQVTVGFKNALLGALASRASRVAQLRALQALPSLPQELNAVRDVDSRGLLGSSARCAALDAIFTRATGAGHAALLRSLPKVSLSAVDGSDAFLDHSRLAYLDAQGARREVLLVRNPYGEAAVAMGALFARSGVEEVLVYGTAASLDRASPVGELHFATRATSPDGVVHDFENHALHPRFSALHDQPATRTGTRIVNVRSPLDEFDGQIERLRAEGHQLIEMELAGLLRGLQGAARVSAIHVVSDVPQGAHTLEGFSPTLAERALAAAVDVWVQRFGIAEVDLGVAGV